MIQLWVADADSAGFIPRRLLDLLDASETEKLRRFGRVSDRRSYLISRILLREGLSRLMGGDPRKWKFAIDDAGKPRLSELSATTPVDFNLTHSGSAVIAAVSSSCRIGVDIERIDRPEIPIDVAFTEREIDLLMSEPPEGRWKRTLRLWTLKEAYAKLLGQGFHLEFSEMDVSSAPRGVHFETHELILESESYCLAIAAHSFTGGAGHPDVRFSGSAWLGLP